MPSDLTYGTDADQHAEGDLERTKEEETDSWLIRGDYVVRIHRQPRIHMFAPADSIDPPPIPLDRIDVIRTTVTDLETVDEKVVEYCWTGKSSNDHRRLSARWIGETRFDTVPEGCEPGYYMVGGRPTRRQASKRPDNIWPEIWNSMSRKQKERAIENWERNGRRLTRQE